MHHESTQCTKDEMSVINTNALAREETLTSGTKLGRYHILCYVILFIRFTNLLPNLFI